MHHRNRRYAHLRITQRSGDRLIGRASALKPQESRHRLKVVLHPMMDLADGGVFRQQSSFTPTNIGGIPQQQHRTVDRARTSQRYRPHKNRRIRTLDVCTPGNSTPRQISDGRVHGSVTLQQPGHDA